MIKLILPGSIRSKKNSKIATMIGGKNTARRAMILPSKAYKAWEGPARKAATAQYRGEIIDAPVHVRVTAYIRGPMPDLSGCLESIGDALQGVVWRDDKLIVSWDGSRIYRDKEAPRTEVEVTPW